MERSALALVDGAFRLSPPQAITLERDAELLPDVREGDIVSIHWGAPIETLDAQRAADLARWTAHALASASHVTARMEETLHPAPSSTR